MFPVDHLNFCNIVCHYVDHLEYCNFECRYLGYCNALCGLFGIMQMFPVIIWGIAIHHIDYL